MTAPLDAPETRYADGGDAYVAYSVVGDGPVDVVFLSSWISQIEELWSSPTAARFFTRLARFSRLIMLDKRGSGLSDPVKGTPSIDERMDDIRAVMDAVGSERAALVGTSEGGPLAAVFAATHPDRTTALVMAGAAARFSQTHDYPWGWDENGSELVQAYMRTRWGTGDSAYLMSPEGAQEESFRQWIGRLERLTGSPMAMLEHWRWTLEIDIRDVLPVISVPSLVLHRVGDVLVPVEHGRYLAEHLPGAKYVELPGSDHYAFLGDVDSMADEIEEFLTGVRHGPEPDRVLATVLFTDIVDSTTRAAELGDRRWRELLERHQAAAAREAERHRGKLVKTTGDGVLVTFDGPGRAVRCGQAIRDRADDLSIDIRVGLHSGEVEVMGDDVGGIAVHIAARVMSHACAGEVLVSSSVPPLVVGSGLEFDDRGESELKGVPGTWRLYSVV